MPFHKNIKRASATNSNNEFLEKLFQHSLFKDNHDDKQRCFLVYESKRRMGENIKLFTLHVIIPNKSYRRDGCDDFLALDTQTGICRYIVMAGKHMNFEEDGKLFRLPVSDFNKELSEIVRDFANKSCGAGLDNIEEMFEITRPVLAEQPRCTIL